MIDVLLLEKILLITFGCVGLEVWGVGRALEGLADVSIFVCSVAKSNDQFQRQKGTSIILAEESVNFAVYRRSIRSSSLSLFGEAPA